MHVIFKWLIRHEIFKIGVSKSLICFRSLQSTPYLCNWSHIVSSWSTKSQYLHVDRDPTIMLYTYKISICTDLFTSATCWPFTLICVVLIHIKAKVWVKSVIFIRFASEIILWFIYFYTGHSKNYFWRTKPPLLIIDIFFTVLLRHHHSYSFTPLYNSIFMFK